MSISSGMAAYRLAFQLSPIIFTGGIASFMPGGGIPIVAITEALNFLDGILGGGADVDLDNFFANFEPLPGSTLASNSFGKYPFANQAVAANARIAQPLKISMRMICPARGDAGYALKLATMTALKTAIAAHDASGGTYTVATPSYFYTNCVLLDFTDTSDARSAQAQNAYQFDFEQPLLTLQDALQAQNNLMSQISGGLPISGTPAWSGLAPSVGNPASLATIGTQPSMSNFAGAQIAEPLMGIFG